MLALIAVLLFLILIALPSGLKILMNIAIGAVLLGVFAAYAGHHDDRADWHNPPCTHGCDP